MTRKRLPDRRRNETAELIFHGTSYAVTMGYYPDSGLPAEVFTHGAKVGSGIDAILDDACVALSMLLQHGVDPGEFAASMGRHHQKPSSIIGALADLLASSNHDS